MSNPPPATDDLQTSIQYVKGVGPQRAQCFAARGLHTIADGLFFLPRRYEDRRRVLTIAELQKGERASLTAEVVDFGARRIGPRRRLFEVLLQDGTGRLTLRWFHFNPETFARRFIRGEQLRVAGKVEVYKGVVQMVHPDVEKIGLGGELTGEDFASIVPIYLEVAGVYPKVVRKIMRAMVERWADRVVETLPKAIRTRRALPAITDALRVVHFPPQDADLEELSAGRSAAHRRVIFEEFFLLQLGLAIRRSRLKSERGIAFEVPADMLAFARALFGFELTGGQRRVLGELLSDMAAEKPMNRLLQGDVGSGKTAIAILAAFVAARSRAQTTLMAPTEILAEQHYRNVRRLLERSRDRLRVGFLSASVKGAERAGLLRRIAAGEVQLVIGTHALIEEQVQFERLGLCVIDEQHRFGVLQRAELRGKGAMPDVLVMTATPIPRTLAMTLYGDLDVSVLDEMPPGRRAVQTVVLEGKKVAQAYRHVLREVAEGHQAFLVYPLVDESDKIALRDATRMFEKLRVGAFANLRLGLLHGRLDAPEKERVMAQFVAHQLDVLVSTTVIEVGVDVARATVMVVEHAERFGLSQLHQLRGRVGRGDWPGVCYLVAHNLASADARSRLKTMEKTTDGFVIAEADLALRGPGEFLGTRQSGLPAFVFGDLVRDTDLLNEARQEALALIAEDPLLTHPEHAPLRRMLRDRWGSKLLLAGIG